MNDPNCLFCKMVAGSIPYHEVWSDEKHIAFLTIFPNMLGATVVIPKQHYGSSPFEQDDTVLHELISATKKTANILTTYFKDVGRCGMVFEGFGVDHLHAKLYPLHGTNLTKWEPIESSENNQYFETYPGYISSNDSHRADDNLLAELAKNIREQTLSES